MARRAKTGLKAGQLFIGLVILAVVVGGGWIFLNHGGDPYATTPTLDIAEYRDRAASLEGNTYKLTCTVQEQLDRSEEKGRLLHVTVKKEDGSVGEPVGILIPAELDDQNIQKGQDFVFVIEVRSRGILVATDVSRI